MSPGILRTWDKLYSFVMTHFPEISQRFSKDEICYILVESDIYPGVLDIIRRMKSKGLIVGCITDGSTDVYRIKPLKELFDFVVNQFVAGGSKKFSLPFMKACELAGVLHSEMVHI
eukprot:986595_1